MRIADYKNYHNKTKVTITLDITLLQKLKTSASVMSNRHHIEFS